MHYSGYSIVIRRNKRIDVTPTLLYFHALNNHQLRTSIRHRIEENHQISRIIVSPESTTKLISYTLTRCKAKAKIFGCPFSGKGFSLLQTSKPALGPTLGPTQIPA
jgi:hypothetical protein